MKPYISRIILPLIHGFMLFTCLLVPITGAADQVFMKNGDKLTGKIVSKTGDKLVLETSYAGQIELLWTDISHLTSDGPIRITLDDESELIGTLATGDDTEILVITDVDSEPKPLPLERIAAINQPEVPRLKISGQTNLGLSRDRGNTDKDAYHLDAETILRWPSDRLRIAVSGDLEETNSEKTEQRAELLGAYDRFLTEKLYLTGGPLFEHDKFADLTLRTTVFGGVGYQFFETDRTNLAVEGGPGYVWENFDDSEDNDFSVAIWRLRFDHFPFEDWKLQAFHNHRMTISPEDNSDYLINAQTGVRMPIYGPVQATLQFNFDRDNAPAAGTKKNDTQYLLTLGYQW